MGDTLYVHGCGIEEWEIQGISLSYISSGEICGIPLNIVKNSMGQRIFLAREEAEQALKEVQE